MNKELLIFNILNILMLLIMFFLTMNIMFLHPIIMMLILLIYSFLICLTLSIWKSNYLYSIMLFLIMISGLLIIFLYFSSLISNEQINFNINNFLLYPFILNSLILTFLTSSLAPNMTSLKSTFVETNSLNKMNEKIFQNILNLYEYPLNNLTIITMLYLLLSLFIIIKISSFKSLSLRKIN